jgi:DNA-binding phage protein
MTQDSPYILALRGAAKIIGDEARLCELLRVPREDLSRWLSGASLPTLDGYVRALDILRVNQPAAYSRA